MKGKFIVLAGSVLLLSATVAMACPNCWSGTGRRYGPSHLSAAQNLSPEQRQEIEQIQAKHSQRLEKLETQMNAKADQIAEAHSKDSTTVRELNALTGDMRELRLQYGTVLDEANRELAGTAGAGSLPWFQCRAPGCAHRHNGMGGHMTMHRQGGWCRGPGAWGSAGTTWQGTYGGKVR